MTEKSMDPLAIVAVITFLIYLSPLFFIAADLWAGVRKAKERGEAITSHKMRRTFTKMNKYYNSLLALSVLDALQVTVLWYMEEYHHWDTVLFPVVTFIGAVCIGIIEVKSILEPATTKERKQVEQVARLARDLARHRGKPAAIAEDLIEYINEKTDPDKQ